MAVLRWLACRHSNVTFGKAGVRLPGRPCREKLRVDVDRKEARMALEINEIAIRMRQGTGDGEFADSGTGTAGSLTVKVPGAGAMSPATYEKLVRAEVQRVLKALAAKATG
jgi:hypothetical protein